MSRLLGRANVKRRNAEIDYQHMGEDDCNVDDCCYNLQQCIELTLKYIVQINGERYVENHDLRAQLNKLDSMGVSGPEEERIRHMASTLNSWEAESRYRESFFATLQDVDEAREIADALIQYASGLVEETDSGMTAFPEDGV